MASADNITVKIEVKASDLVDACIKALTEDGTLTEVVRCKECKFWGESLTEEERSECDVYADLVCTYWMSDGLTRDDFCSKGERRNDATD